MANYQKVDDSAGGGNSIRNIFEIFGVVDGEQGDEGEGDGIGGQGDVSGDIGGLLQGEQEVEQVNTLTKCLHLTG